MPKGCSPESNAAIGSVLTSMLDNVNWLIQTVGNWLTLMLTKGRPITP